jgi:hypothetical protein
MIFYVPGDSKCITFQKYNPGHPPVGADSSALINITPGSFSLSSCAQRRISFSESTADQCPGLGVGSGDGLGVGLGVGLGFGVAVGVGFGVAVGVGLAVGDGVGVTAGVPFKLFT